METIKQLLSNSHVLKSLDKNSDTKMGNNRYDKTVFGWDNLFMVRFANEHTNSLHVASRLAHMRLNALLSSGAGHQRFHVA